MTRNQARLMIGGPILIIAGLIAGGIWWALQGNSDDASLRAPTVTESVSAAAAGGLHIDVDRSDRDAVAKKAAQILTTWDPAQEDTEAAAVRRAKPLLSAKVFELNSTEVRSGSAGLWMEMAVQNAKSVPRVEIQDDEHAQEERPNADALTVLVRWEWIGPTMRTTNPETRLFFMQMQQNVEGEWEVGDYNYTDIPSSYLGNKLE